MKIRASYVMIMVGLGFRLENRDLLGILVVKKPKPKIQILEPNALLSVNFEIGI